jgi:hypothetical protein
MYWYTNRVRDPVTLGDVDVDVRLQPAAQPAARPLDPAAQICIASTWADEECQRTPSTKHREAFHSSYQISPRDSAYSKELLSNKVPAET